MQRQNPPCVTSSQKAKGIILYHKSGAQQQAVQRLSDVSSVDVAVVGIAVFAVASLQGRQELCEARDGNLQQRLHNDQQ